MAKKTIKDKKKLVLVCYLGEGGWMYLDSGTIESLAKKTMPHLELESFYELM